MKIIADLHVHTVASGHAYSTLQEVLLTAQEKGLEVLAITDHGPGMPGAPHPYYFSNMRVLPTEFQGMTLLRGIEANVMDRQGGLDLPLRYLKNLDIVLAGFHEDCLIPGSVEENTQAMLMAMENPYVDIIVHPGNPNFAIDQEKIVQASLALGVPLEINNSSLTTSGTRKGSWDNCRQIAKLAARYGSFVSLGSDAHWAPLIGKFDKALELVLEAGIKPEKILNTSAETINSFLTQRRQARSNIR